MLTGWACAMTTRRIRGTRRTRSRSCSQDDLRATGGNGLFYCFATD